MFIYCACHVFTTALSISLLLLYRKKLYFPWNTTKDREIAVKDRILLFLCDVLRINSQALQVYSLVDMAEGRSGTAWLCVILHSSLVQFNWLLIQIVRDVTQLMREIEYFFLGYHRTSAMNVYLLLTTETQAGSLGP